jgi:hypothetical protein
MRIYPTTSELQGCHKVAMILVAEWEVVNWRQK